MPAHLAEGSYFGKIINAGLTEVGTNATPAMQIGFMLTHGANNGEWVEMAHPVERDVTFWLTDKAREFAFRDLDMLGFNGDWDNPKFRDDLSTDGCELVIEHEIYNGKKQERVSIAMLRRGRDRKAPKPDIKHLIAAEYKQQVGSKPVPPPVKPAAPPTPKAAIAKADDANEPPF